MINSPIISYFGGKWNMGKTITALIPETDVFVDVFGGGCNIILSKNPSKVEVYNDLNGNLTNLFDAFRDENRFEKLYKRVYSTPYSLIEFERAVKIIKNEIEHDEDDSAWAAYVYFNQCSMGLPNKLRKTGWERRIAGSNKKFKTWVKKIGLFDEYHLRLKNIVIENSDFRKIISFYDGDNVSFYCDPPYLSATRITKNVYAAELTCFDHEELINLLLNIKGYAVLSGYQNKIYRLLEENGWERKEFSSFAYCSTLNKFVNIDKRVECVWLNPKAAEKQEQIELFR